MRSLCMFTHAIIPIQQADLLPAERKSELEKKLDDFEVLLKAMQAKLEDLHEQNKVTKIWGLKPSCLFM